MQYVVVVTIPDDGPDPDHDLGIEWVASMVNLGLHGTDLESWKVCPLSEVIAS